MNAPFTTPTDALSQYRFPGGKRPFDTQCKTVALLTSNHRAYCLSGMGVGKTKAALWSYDFLASSGLAKKGLIVAPLSTLYFVWAREILATIPHRTAVVLHGTREKRLKLLEENADLYIVNHDGLSVVYNELLDKGIDTVIIDELATFRTGTAKRTKIMRAFASQMKWCWGLTGLPTPHSPTDAWSQAKIVTPERAPKFFGRFRDMTMQRVTQFKFVPKREAMDIVFAMLQPAVRFELDDVVELPECTERTIDVDMTPQQQKVYKEMERHAFTMVGQHTLTAMNAGSIMMKLTQISMGWVYKRDGTTVELDNAPRVNAIVDLINDSDQKVIVFVPFIHAMNGISKRLTKEGIDHALVSGDTSSRDRSDIFGKFQHTDSIKVLVAHPRCMAHGITLTKATTIIWSAPTADLEIFSQANARIRRVGQTKKQQILMLQSTPVEKRLYAMLRTKQKTSNVLLDLFAGASEFAHTG